MKDLLEIGNALQSRNFENCAMATVIQVQGSAYRREGARMLIAPDGQTCGMISGGCLEHDVLNHARSAMRNRAARILRYDSTSADDLIFGTGLGCNGVVDVLVEPVSRFFRESLIGTLETVQQTRQTGGLATFVTGEKGSLGSRHAFYHGAEWIGDADLLSTLNQQTFLNGDACFTETMANDNTRLFIQKLPAPIRLVIFGGWLDVVPVIQFAQQIGFKVSVVDSRRRKSSEQLFAQADEVLLCSPEEALTRLPFDQRTVALLMNHNFEQDQEALTALVRSELPYIGMLGPKKRQQKILTAMAHNGILFSDEFIHTLHGPVGLDIGAKSADEIALAIVAEILATLNARDAKPIRERSIPLHIQATQMAYA